MALLNVKIAHEIYPDWVCWFFIDKTLPLYQAQRLIDSGSEIYIVTDPELTNGNIRGMFWRFLVFDVDPEVSVFLSRDVDSLINIREKYAVDEWLASDFGFHGMRDNPGHHVPIMGGMWGAKRGALPPNLIDLARKHRKNNRGQDQDFLADFVWPHIINDQMTHDSFLCDQFPNSRPFPRPRAWINGPFVGAYCNVTGICDNLAPKYSDRNAPNRCRPHPDATSG